MQRTFSGEHYSDFNSELTDDCHNRRLNKNTTILATIYKLQIFHIFISVNRDKLHAL